MLILEQGKLSGRFSGSCSRILLLFIAYIMISTPFTEWPGSVLRGNLVDFIKAIVFFYFTILIVDTDVRLKHFIFIFMACQIVRILEPLYLHELYGYWGSQTYLGYGEFADRLGGAPSDIINPNELAFLIAMLFPFLHYLWGNGRFLAKFSYLSLVPALLYVLVLTMSRSGFIAMLIIAWNIFIKSRYKLVLIIAGCIISIMAWTNMTEIQKDRYISITGAEEVQGASTFRGRTDGMMTELGVALERPVVGHGLGTSREAMYNVAGGAQISHNLYLETLMETGIIGLLIYLFFLKAVHDTLKQANGRLFKADNQDKKRKKGKPYSDSDFLRYERNLLMALIAVFWMFIIFSFAQYGLSRYHWYFLAGAAVVLHRQITEKTILPNKTLS
ncbi:O-antigen ligase family protein [Methylohalomonas lacus]|nr:O-antigen ligase family protein [Methylohalomonas lacus]